jgi:hypothetical protein
MTEANTNLFSDWRTRTDCALRSRYAVTLEDIGLSDSELRRGWMSGQLPDEFAQWFGMKYDLVSKDEWFARA